VPTPVPAQYFQDVTWRATFDGGVSWIGGALRVAALRGKAPGGENVTTFVAMSYIIAVNPAILKAAGIPEGPSMVATILTAIFGTLIMGLYANRPFAIAPYMGENAFVAYTVVRMLGYRWETALGAVFIAGLLFTALTVARIREWMVEAVPPSLRYSFAVGIGLDENTAAFIHDMDAAAISNVAGESNYVRVQVLTPVGVLDRDKQLAVVAQFTDLVARAAGDDGLAHRTWVLLTEATPGGWGLAGHANTNDELVVAARAQIAQLSANQ